MEMTFRLLLCRFIWGFLLHLFIAITEVFGDPLLLLFFRQLVLFGKFCDFIPRLLSVNASDFLNFVLGTLVDIGQAYPRLLLLFFLILLFARLRIGVKVVSAHLFELLGHGSEDVVEKCECTVKLMRLDHSEIIIIFNNKMLTRI